MTELYIGIRWKGVSVGNVQRPKRLVDEDRSQARLRSPPFVEGFGNVSGIVGVRGKITCRLEICHAPNTSQTDAVGRRHFDHAFFLKLLKI